MGNQLAGHTGQEKEKVSNVVIIGTKVRERFKVGQPLEDLELKEERFADWAVETVFDLQRKTATERRKSTLHTESWR
jgi:dissimilatory sulfite reductase (desulfoviridin) alpha/beta subunit